MSSHVSNVPCDICRFEHPVGDNLHLLYPSKPVWFCEIPVLPEWEDYTGLGEILLLSRQGVYLLRISEENQGARMVLNLFAYLYKPESIGELMYKVMHYTLSQWEYDTFDKRDAGLKDLKENALSYLTVLHL